MLNKATKTLLRTQDSLLPTILRLALGTVIFAHGAQKALGWFGGYGYDATMGFLTQGVGLPAIIAFTVIVVEFVGGAALIVGAGGRLAALGVGSVMFGAVLTSHMSHGFFMNWAGAKGGEGFEYHILAMALAAGVVIAGSGAYSVDRWLSRRLEGATDSAHGLAPSAA